MWASPENGLTVRVACWSSSRMTRVVTMCYKFLSFEMSNVTHALGKTSVNLPIHIMCPSLNFEYFVIFVYSSKPVKTEKKFYCLYSQLKTLKHMVTTLIFWKTAINESTFSVAWRQKSRKVGYESWSYHCVNHLFLVTVILDQYIFTYFRKHSHMTSDVWGVFFTRVGVMQFTCSLVFESIQSMWKRAFRQVQK